MPKLIYVYGDDNKLLDTLVSSLRANGYSLEHTNMSDETGAGNVSADVALICKPIAPTNQISMGGLTMDFDNICATTDDGEVLHLTPTEFSMLGYLMKNSTRAIPRAELLAEVWHFHDTGTRVADDTVKRIRKKIANTRLRIETIWGYGFKASEDL